MKTYEKPEAKLELFVTEEITANSSIGTGENTNPTFNPWGG